jgi:hypothetical protein
VKNASQTDIFQQTLCRLQSFNNPHFDQLLYYQKLFVRKEGLAASSIILCFAIQGVLKDNDFAVYEGIAFRAFP